MERNQEQYNTIKKASEGDMLAFETLYREKAKSILFRAVKLTGNWQDGEDLAQEVVIKMYKNIGKLKNPDLFGSWLHSIILNESNNMYKKKNAKKQPQTVAEEYSAYLVEDRMEFLPQEYLENMEKQKELMDIIQSLPEKQQNVLLLYYYEGLSCSEIATSSNVSVSTVTTNLMKAKRSILKKVEKTHSTTGVRMLAMMPVLQAVYRSNIDHAVSDVALNHFIGKVTQALTNSATATVASAAGTAAVISASTKVMIGVSAGILLVAGSLATYFGTGANGLDKSTSEDIPSAVPQMADGFSTDETMQQIDGQVRFKGNDGQIINESGFLLEGISVLLKDQEEEVARTTVDGSGYYSFGQVSLKENRNYVLKLDIPLGAGYKDVSTMKYFTGKEEIPGDLYLSVTATPQGKLNLSSRDCACGHVNPLRISYEEIQSPISEYRWTIASSDGMAVATGSGREIQQEVQELFNRKKDGWYTVSYEVVDVFGNAAKLQGDFVIDSGPIGSNQYS